jgi:hypothetical protein
MISRHLGKTMALILLSMCVIWAVAQGSDNSDMTRNFRNLSPKKHEVTTSFPGSQSDQNLPLPLSVDGEIDSLIYDDGEPVSAYYWHPGYRMAVHMSPDTTQGECRIVAVMYYHWVPGAFLPGIYAWSGSSPADTLLEWNDTTTATGFSTFFVDTADIVVPGDFVVSHGVVDTITALGYDSYNNGRAWDFNPGAGTWSPYLETYFIRAIVEYPPYGAVPPNLDVLAPANAALEPPYPNPFNPATNFVIKLEHSGSVSLKIYDLLGREVASLLGGYLPGGSVQVSWDAGQNPSGTYWAVLSVGSDTAVRQLILLK